MKKSWTQKVIGGLIAVFLVTVVFFAFVRFSQKTQNNIDDYAEITLSEIVALQKKTIYSSLTADIGLLSNIAALFETENFTFEDASKFMNKVKIDHGFHQLLLFNSDGTAVTFDQTQAEITYDDVASQFETREPIFYNPSDSIVTDDFILTMSSPVYNSETGEISYILVGVQTLDVLQDYIENTFGINGNIGVFDSDGELIFSNQLNQLNNDIRRAYISNLFDAITAPITSEQLIADLKENKSGSFVYEYGRSEIFFQYAPLGINDWFIAIHLNKSSLASRADLASRDAFSFLIILSVCVLILGIYIYSVNSRVKKELYHLAFYDQLTGLTNGVHFKLELEKTLAREADKSFFCIVFDICNFKLINDRFGYAVGDKVLCTIADTVSETIAKKFPNEIARIAKLHSDTFVILLPAISIELCDEQMERLIKVIRANTGLMQEYKIDFYLGRYITQDYDTAEMVIERALNAHSHAKSQAPNRFVDFDDVFIDKLRTRADILNCFDEAIDNNEFQLYFQPQFSANTKEIHGTEILVRWIKDGKMRYTPDVFIPVLENTGRISKLDSFLREKLCNVIRGWLDNNMKLPHFSVNVSRIELIQPDFVLKLQELLEKYNIPPTMIHVEITETAYTGDQGALASKIAQLQSSGFLVEMDDFGSGYSSLNVLKDIPVDIVKLDMKLIETSTTSARSSNILTSIIRMAQSINLITIAEGVETQDQVDYLESIGCNYLQGYFFAKPMPANDYIKLLEKHNFIGEGDSTQQKT